MGTMEVAAAVAGGGVLAVVLGAFANQFVILWGTVFKEVGRWFFDLFFVRSLAMEHVHRMIEISLTKQWKKRHHYIRTDQEYVKPLGERRPVLRWESKGNGFRVLWYKKAPVVLYTDENTPGWWVCWLKGTINREEFFKHVEDVAAQKMKEHADAQAEKHSYRPKVFVYGAEDRSSDDTGDPPSNGNAEKKNVDYETYPLLREMSKWYANWDADDLGVPMPDDMLSVMYLDPRVKSLADDVKAWRKRKEWCAERDIPWKRGYHLTGKPGTGKTTLIKAVAQACKLDIHRFCLSGMSEPEFRNNWDALVGTERIVVFEDLDRLGESGQVLERRNDEDDEDDREHFGRVGQGFSFGVRMDAVLNAIDGVEPDHGLILFVTSNDPTKIDVALGVDDGTGRSTRPGRVDYVLTMPDTLPEEGRRKVASRVLRGDLEGQEKAVAEGETDTPAQFTARCIREALSRG